MIVVNALGALSGGGRTWTQGVLEQLRDEGPRAAEWEFVVSPNLARSVAAGGAVPARLLTRPVPSTRRRLAWEQVALVHRPGLLVSGGNFGPLARRQRHVVVAHNALHFQPVTVAGRAGTRLRGEALLARASVRRATATIVATSHMASLVEDSTGVKAVVLPFGPGLVKRRRPPSGRRFVFLHRTGWGPHKRLIDLLLAVRELATSDRDRFVVRSACDPTTKFAVGFAESRLERRLLEDPLVAAHVEISELSPNDQRELYGDAVVIPSTTESFCFPIAEAVGFGVPVVAADSPFARELCDGGGAMLVPAGNHRRLAAGMRALLRGERPKPPPAQAASRLSWRNHVDGLAALCNRPMARR